MGGRKEAEQLGMSYGAAIGKLRKIILLDVLKKYKDNFCFRCGKEIVTEQEFSIEHKEPWRGANTDLFWDLGNITWSHVTCNSREGAKRSYQLHGNFSTPEGSAKGGRNAAHNRWHVKQDKPCACE